MGRPPKKDDDDPFGDLVAYAFLMTNLAQRQEVADSWHKGIPRHEQYGKLLRIDPGALLLASLLEAEDNVVCDPTGRPRDYHYGRLFTLVVDNCPKPVDNPVDNSGVCVDNPVDKLGTTVDNYLSYQQLCTTSSRRVDNLGFFHKLSTSYPQPER
jgi:hypothetical protein